jgi:biopolymer transport protein ExbB
MKLRLLAYVALMVLVLALVRHRPAVAQPADSGATDDGEQVSVFDHFVRQGGPITWFVLIPMSVAMVAMSIGHFLLIRRQTLIPPLLRDDVAEQAEARDVAGILEVIEDDPSMLGAALQAGVNEAAHGHEAMTHAVQEVTDERAAHLFRRIEHLNVLGNVAPMVGLLGTVYGMIRAFHSLVETGGVPDPRKLAFGISVALVTTFWGLLVAIPALAVYAISRNRIEALTPECAMVAEELLRPLHDGPREPDAPASSSEG